MEGEAALGCRALLGGNGHLSPRDIKGTEGVQCRLEHTKLGGGQLVKGAAWSFLVLCKLVSGTGEKPHTLTISLRVLNVIKDY